MMVFLMRKSSVGYLFMISPVLAKKTVKHSAIIHRTALNFLSFSQIYFPGLDQKCKYPAFYDDISTALFFHDFGKAASGFQNQFRPNNPHYHYRHEILSVPFVESLHLGDTEFIKELVLTHHKTLDRLSDYVEHEDSLNSRIFRSFVRNQQKSPLP